MTEQQAVLDMLEILECGGCVEPAHFFTLMRRTFRIAHLLYLEAEPYADELKNPAEFEGEVPEVDVPKQELQIARTLVAQLSPEEFDITSFKDRYEDRLKQLIDAKVAGEQVMAAPEEEPAPVINLMEALQKSLQQAQEAAKPPKKVAAGTAGKKAAAARKRKTS